jgi:DNA-binding IclR family transcriptional regulator
MNALTAASASSAAPQSVGRVFAVLDHLVAHRDGATLSELASSCGAPKSSLVGLLGGMLAERSLVRHDDGRYAIGPRLIGLAMRAVAGAELRTVARPFLEQLMRTTGETAALGMLTPEGDLFTYVERVESFQPVRYAIAVGERRELHCTAIGKVLLAWLDKPRLDAWLVAHPLRRFTPNTITSTARFREELRAVRAEGLARTDGERFVDAAGIGAPVFLADGTAGAGLLVAGPLARMRERAAANEKALRQVAAELSDALGASTRRSGGAR